MSIKNIQNRVLIVFLPLLFIVLGVLSGSSYYLANQALTQSVGETAFAIGTDYSMRLKVSMDRVVLQLEDLASIQRIRTGTDKTQIMEAMTEALNRLGTIDSLSFISPDGSGFRANGVSNNLADRDYFKKAVATGKPAFSNTLLSKTTGNLAIAVAVPVTNNGKLTGVLAASVNLDRLIPLIKDVKLLDTGYGLVADATGLVIAHPKNPEFAGKLNLTQTKMNPELNMPNVENDERMVTLFKAAAATGEQKQGEYDFFGMRRIAVVTPVDLPGDQRWVMLVTAPAAEATAKMSTLARTMLSISLGFFILAAVFVVIATRRFTKPIVQLRDECLLLAQGDLRACEVKIASDDEIGQLAQGFREMRNNLRRLVADVSSRSEQLAASSEELTASADQSAQAANQVATSIAGVASGVEEQLAATDDTSDVVEEISASIEQIVSTTSKVAEQSEQAANKANEGNESVKKAVSQMTAIEKSTKAAADAVTKLNDQSKEIGTIVGTISGIAGQTNLLALNAAIEAARAGEQGRGFAVVSEEVRKLAEQSQEAAKQIATLIGEIQGDTDKAVIAMNNGAREVQLGSEVVNTAGQAFQEIVVLVTNVSGQIQDISAAMEQMAAGSQQIKTSMGRIDGLSEKAAKEAEGVAAATEEQLASMQEIAASSQSLAKLAQDLQEAVSKFQV